MTRAATRKVSRRKAKIFNGFQIHPLVVGQGIDGYMLRVCIQHRMLGFECLWMRDKWRYVGQKWNEQDAVLAYCKGRDCPMMKPPSVDWRLNRLLKLSSLLDFCQGKELKEHVYTKHWGWWDSTSFEDAYH